MADTFSTSFEFTIQTIGGNNNTWGGILNDNFTAIDLAIGGVLSIAVTGADVTLTDEQNRNPIILCSGTLTGNRSVIVKTQSKRFWVQNDCAGAFDLTVKTSAGTGIVVPTGEKRLVFCDGTNVEELTGSLASLSSLTSAYVGAGAIVTAGLADAAVTLVKLAAEVTAGLGVTGDIKLTILATAPSGWVFLNGGTVGNAASSATLRANADAEDLFAALWDGSTNTELPIQDSAGSATTRGASAAADFAANKRMPVPDFRDRVPVGGQMGAGAAGLIDNTLTGLNTGTLFDTGGLGGIILTEAQLADHGHPFRLSNVDGSVQAGRTGGFATAVAGSVNQAAFTGTPSDTEGEQIGGTGSDEAHSNVQPSMTINFIVKL